MAAVFFSWCFRSPQPTLDTVLHFVPGGIFFFQVCSQSCIVESAQHFPEVVKVLLISGVDDHVVEVGHCLRVNGVLAQFPAIFEMLWVPHGARRNGPS